MSQHIDKVKDYYGRVLQSKNDLKTSACCTAESFSAQLKPIASLIHPEVRERFYGCGVPIPPVLNGLTVLDLGCGTGRDAFLLSKLVGESGRVIGVDMTPAQLEIANKHKNYHRDAFGYKESNVDFRQGYIENLNDLDIADNSIDLVVSNCVFNLSPNKEQLYKEVLRVLKPGGELYFSDVYSDRRLPQHAAEDPVLLGECLGGALYTEDLRRIFAKLGVMDCRLVKSSPVEVQDKKVRSRLEGAQFSSLTMRVFKLDLEDRCEDYGQVAYYRGGIEEHDQEFTLDNHHLFIKDKPMLVCSNTASMISKTRYGKFFEIIGDTSKHFGLFNCSSPSIVTKKETANNCC